MAAEHKLPEIWETLVTVLEHFEPLAKSIHAEATEGFISGKTFFLTQEWLDLELGKAQRQFLTKRGQWP
jgi:hypothetical protein